MNNNNGIDYQQFKARDLFNGNIVGNNNKRTFNEMQHTNNYYNSYQPSYKKTRYENWNNQTPNYNQQQYTQNDANNDWYMYL